MYFLPLLEKYREDKNWTLLELSKRSGLTLTTLSRLQNCKHAARHTTVRKLAKALGVTYEQLTTKDVDPVETNPCQNKHLYDVCGFGETVICFCRACGVSWLLDKENENKPRWLTIAK